MEGWVLVSKEGRITLLGGLDVGRTHSFLLIDDCVRAMQDVYVFCANMQTIAHTRMCI